MSDNYFKNKNFNAGMFQQFKEATNNDQRSFVETDGKIIKSIRSHLEQKPGNMNQNHKDWHSNSSHLDKHTDRHTNHAKHFEEQESDDNGFVTDIKPLNL